MIWPDYAAPSDSAALADVDLLEGDRPGLERLLIACDRWSATAGEEDGLTLDDLAAIACRA